MVTAKEIYFKFNALNAELNSICHLLVLLKAHPILHISSIRVKYRLVGMPVKF
jgi:hypothetical protein